MLLINFGAKVGIFRELTKRFTFFNFSPAKMLKFLNERKKVVFYPCVYQNFSYFINNIFAHPYKANILTDEKIRSLLRLFVLSGHLPISPKKMQEEANMAPIRAK